MAKKQETAKVPKNIRDLEAKRLRALWDAHQEQNVSATQDLFGARYEVTQGYVWQMLKGQTHLNLKRANQFAEFLHVDISAFSPRLAEERDSLIIDGAATRKVVQQSRGVPLVWAAQPDETGRWVGQPLRGALGGRVKYDSRDPEAYAIRVNGTNLAPRVKPGDYLIIEPGRKPEAGDEVVVTTEDGGSLALEFLYERDGNVTFESVNMNRSRVQMPKDRIKSMHCIAAIVRHFNFTHD